MIRQTSKCWVEVYVMTYKLTKLRELLSEVEKCLKCYKELDKYPDEDRVRIRKWYHKDPWFFPPHEETGLRGSLELGMYASFAKGLVRGVAKHQTSLHFGFTSC
ncbi:MAG: hypothetical protein QW186_09370 [Candidatus Bathyarchaeia archaeon]